MIEGREVVCTRGAIATGPAEGARAGARIFESGGNAMDAVAAACLACAVVEPQACDLGGYVAAGVVLDGKAGEIWSVDANSVGPQAAREDMYETLPPKPGKRGINELEYGCSVRDDANVYGPLSVGVPGFMAGVGTIHERWGRMPWADIVAPAQELVESGFPYALVHQAALLKKDALARFAPGDPWFRPDLARTLQRLSSSGWRDFYDGEIGAAIADCVISQGGILTRQDMAAFTVRVTKPLAGEYRGAKVYTAIAPGGGYSVLSALDELPRTSERDPEYWHRLADTLQRMWQRRLLDSRTGATPHGTIHVAAADAEGNLVSVTISQGGLFGSCLAVPGTGIILGHGMCRFDPHPGLDNSPGPGKRPLNNVCPLIIRMPGRDVAIGARGGRRIVSVCAQMAQRIVDLGSSAREAATAPRMHTITGDPLEVSRNFDPAIRERLEEMGHRIEVPDEVAGAAHGAEILRESVQLRAGGNTWSAGISASPVKES